MKKLMITAFAVALSQLSFAQITKDVGSFTSVRAYDKIPVQLISSSSNKVEVAGTKGSDVEVVNKNGELKIRMTTLNLMQGDDVAVKVYFTDLNEIQSSQGSVITSGSTIKSNMMSVTANEGSSVNLDLNVENLDVKANTGGNINLQGTANHQTAIVNTGATYNGRNLKTTSTSITVNAGGNASVNASESVDAKTRAGGNITVYGNPKHKKNKKVLGGNIDFK